MHVLTQEQSTLIHHLTLQHSNVTVDEIEQYLDRLLQSFKTISYRPKKTDGIDLLTVVCDDLSNLHKIQLFNHPIVINHPIFISIGQALEMLLTKSNHSQTIPMRKHEEDAFYSISYLITQLCLHCNECIASFYGKFSDQIHFVTDKPNLRDDTIESSARKVKDLTENPNLKTARLHPTAPKSRPTERNERNLEMIHRPKKYPNRLINIIKEPSPITVTKFSSKTPSSLEDLPRKTYQDVFLTDTFFEKLRRGIDDLSQTDYPSYHVKCKVIDRLVRLCSKLNAVDPICDSIVKCLCSNMYNQSFGTIESEQIRLTPKQLFFIYRCPQLIIRHEFWQKENIIKQLCPVMIVKTKLIIDQVLSDHDEKADSTHQKERGLILQGLCSHLELINHLLLTSFGRRYFLQSSTSNHMIRILQTQSLLNNACNNEEFFDVNVRIIASVLMSLCNLAYEKTFLLLLKRTDFQAIYNKLNQAKEASIKFAYDTLSMILSESDIDEMYEPMTVKQEYLKFLQDNVFEPKQLLASSGVRVYKNQDLNIKYTVLTKEFVDTSRDNIKDLSENGYEANDKKYIRAAQRVRACAKQNTYEVEPLLTPVMYCLGSRIYLNVFKNIELANTKVASRALLSNRALAPKHIFFMRECPDFLIQHGHLRQKKVNDLLAEKMLQNTVTIFEQHLSIVTQSESRTEMTRERPDENNEEARIEALSYHIKLLNYFAMQRAIRSEFLSTSIIEDIITVLQNRALLDKSERILGKRIDLIGQSLTLLYNLAVDKQILLLLKSKNLSDTCSKLCDTHDKTVQFISQILLVTLDKTCPQLPEINSLSKTSIKYLHESIRLPQLCYHGIKLNILLKDLKIIIKNKNDSSFKEILAEDKDGITVMANCVSGFQENKKRKKKGEVEYSKPDAKTLEKVQHLAVDIVWALSSYGPTIIKTLKLNDDCIDKILKICIGSADKPKQVAEAIIWRLGSEKILRFEQTQKEEERARNRREDQTDMMDNERLTTTDQWDDSVPFDLLMSYSNNFNDKIISLKIADRLRQRNHRVYTEKQGKHRLELMEIAIGKQKPILACLSSKFRESKFCMAEVDQASKMKCPVIPVIVEENYTVKGWLNHIIANRTPIKFTNKNFNEALGNLILEINELKDIEQTA